MQLKVLFIIIKISHANEQSILWKLIILGIFKEKALK